VTTDDRYDIDLGEYLRGLAHWWWVIVLLAALGAVLGAGLTMAHHKTYLATSSVYLGQPTDANGNSISALNTDPRAAIQLGTAEDTLARVARKIGRGETAGRLRAGVSVVAPPPATKAAGTPLCDHRDAEMNGLKRLPNEHVVLVSQSGTRKGLTMALING